MVTENLIELLEFEFVPFKHFIDITFILFVVNGFYLCLIVGEQEISIGEDSALLDEISLDDVVGIS